MSTSTTPVGERLALVAQWLGMDHARLSRESGLAQGHVGAIIRGTVKSPAAATLAAISERSGASLGWIITGSGDSEVERAAVERARASQPAAPATEAA